MKEKCCCLRRKNQKSCEQASFVMGKGNNKRDFKEKEHKDTRKQELLGWLAGNALHIVRCKTFIDVAECVFIGNHLDGGGHLKQAISGVITQSCIDGLHFCKVWAFQWRILIPFNVREFVACCPTLHFHRDQFAGLICGKQLYGRTKKCGGL